MPHSSFRITVAAVILAATPPVVNAQVTQADYVRAAGLSSAYTGLVPGIVDAPVWLDDGRFWYRRTVSGGHTFVLVDPSAPRKADAFDHDGMRTANRSKAFHDVAWRNLGDAGFPDRILWHQAAAKRYPEYDITRVDIYGGSAGGQSSTGALLFHPEFYRAAVSFAGCHDNRMDKIWWNEQWMGTVGPHYDASSNVVHAKNLKGKLLLIVPELDTNVDPSSSLQVVNALIKANKQFDLLVMPGEEHGGGRRGPSARYGDRWLWDFFVRHLRGEPTPDWNAVASELTTPTGTPLSTSPASAGTFGPSWQQIFAGWERD